jgi:hypothetical protein
VVPGKRVGKNLYLFSSEEKCAVFFGTTPIYVYDRADEGAEAACIASLSRAALAKDVEIASAFGVHRNTWGGWRAAWSEKAWLRSFRPGGGQKDPGKQRVT